MDTEEWIVISYDTSETLSNDENKSLETSLVLSSPESHGSHERLANTILSSNFDYIQPIIKLDENAIVPDSVIFLLPTSISGKQRKRQYLYTFMQNFLGIALVVNICVFFLYLSLKHVLLSL
jgi:hypothetical protein